MLRNSGLDLLELSVLMLNFGLICLIGGTGNILSKGLDFS